MAAIQENILKLRTYLQETQTEAKKVVWPTRQYVIAAGIIVLFIVAVVVLFVMGVDVVFAALFQFLGKAF